MQGLKSKQKINVITLGCWKNAVDSENLLGQLKGQRADIVDNADDADTVVINTCGFIEAAKKESIDTIMQAVRKKELGRVKKVVVMGCLAERYRQELVAEIPEVDAFFGTSQLEQVLKELEVDFKKDLVGERLLSTPSHFAYLKISEGCDHPCSFCAIPLMRGTHRTKPREEVLAEATMLAGQGVKELILIAQDSTYYGLDLYGERVLPQLVENLASVRGIEWIRLMYAYPSKFPTELLNVFKNNPNVCRYLDIPVQHASDDVLKSMRRGITNRATRDLLARIRSEVPNIALRTTLIVGYPNETEKDFQTLCDFVRETRFHRLGVFTYSREDGTTAHPLEDPIPQHVKEERRSVIMEIQKEISEERNQSLFGSTVKILIDRQEQGSFVGRTEWDAPEIDQEVYVKSEMPLKIGNFYDATIVDGTEYDLYAEFVTRREGVVV
jgi:ribosomal protein S12 methylthiotransferase